MVNKIFSCHQPNFLPWIGYFHKIVSSDVFIILDEVQYTKNSVANRNSIKTQNGATTITVPISKKSNGTSFFSYNEANIAIKDWHIKVLKSIEQNYSKAAFFNRYFNEISTIFEIDNFTKMNINFIYFVLEELDIKTKIVLMSDINKELGTKNDLLIGIGKIFEANIYLSGNGAKKYNDINKFKNAGIDLIYQNYKPIEYKQLHLPFLENLSILDFLFNEGPNCKNLLNKQLI